MKNEKRNNATVRNYCASTVMKIEEAAEPNIQPRVVLVNAPPPAERTNNSNKKIKLVCSRLEINLAGYVDRISKLNALTLFINLASPRVFFRFRFVAVPKPSPFR